MEILLKRKLRSTWDSPVLARWSGGHLIESQYQMSQMETLGISWPNWPLKCVIISKVWCECDEINICLSHLATRQIAPVYAALSVDWIIQMSIDDNGQTNKLEFVFAALTCLNVPVCECRMIGNRFGFPAMLIFQEAMPDGRLVGRTNVCVFVCATWGVLSSLHVLCLWPRPDVSFYVHCVLFMESQICLENK